MGVSLTTWTSHCWHWRCACNGHWHSGRRVRVLGLGSSGSFPREARSGSPPTVGKALAACSTSPPSLPARCLLTSSRSLGIHIQLLLSWNIMEDDWSRTRATIIINTINKVKMFYSFTISTFIPLKTYFFIFQFFLAPRGNNVPHWESSYISLCIT